MNPETIALLARLALELGQIATSLAEAHAAGDQAALDAVHKRLVATSDALFPADVAPVAVED